MAERKGVAGRPWWSVTLSMVGHVIAVGAFALVTLWWQLREVDPGLLSWASQRGYDVADANAMELWCHVAICALIWVSACAAWTHGVKHRGVKRVRLAHARRGSVMVETLIAVPVFLVIMCGLIQLTLINIAAIMTDVAAIQAGRTAYVWHGEVSLGSKVARSSGYGIPSKDNVLERSRIVASGVLAAVAPGTSSDTCVSSNEFNQYLNAVNKGMSISGNFVGNLTANNMLIRFNSLQNRATRDNRSLSTAFDSSNFDFRPALKLVTAYCNTAVEYTIEGDAFKTKVSYDHKLTVPITGFAFSNIAPKGNLFMRQYYTQIQRTYVLPAPGIPPNPYTPVSLMSGILDLNPFG